MLRSIVAAAALTALTGTAALAGAPRPAAEPAQAQAQAQAEPALERGQERVKVRCRDEVRTGTRFAKRSCRRLDDLARAEREAVEELNDVSRGKTFIDMSGRTP